MALPGCGSSATDWAIAVINPTAGNAISGTVSFRLVDGGVRIVAEVMGPTAGDHGFHIHEFGDCSGADGKTAGGHFNPRGTDHGGPDSAVRHDFTTQPTGAAGARLGCGVIGVQNTSG